MTTVPKGPRSTIITLASDGAGPFEVGFRLFDNDGLNVYVDNARVTTGWTLSATYSGGYDDTATISFATALTAGRVLRIEGALSPNRAANYIAGSPGLVAAMNTELARLWSSVAEIDREVSRSLRGFQDIDPQATLDLAAISTAVDSARVYDDYATAQAAMVASGVDTISVLAPTGGRVLHYSRAASTTGAALVTNLGAVGWVPSFEVSALHFGAEGDGVADDLLPIQAAIDFVSARNGGEVLFPAGTYRVTGQIEVQQNGVMLVGDGQGGIGSGITTTRASAATRIFWGGSADSDAAVVEFRTPGGMGIRSGGGAKHIMFDAMNLAGDGLRLVSWNRGEFEDCVIYGATANHLLLTTTTETLSAQPYDCLRNRFANIFLTSKNLPSNSANGIHIRRDPASPGTGNSSFNQFINCQVAADASSGNEGLSFIFGNSDSNTVLGGSFGLVVFGSEDDFGYARYNHLFGVNANILAKAGTGGTSSAFNRVFGLNKANGLGNITVETPSGGSAVPTVFVDWVDGERFAPARTPGAGASRLSQTDNGIFETGTWTVGVEGLTTAGTATIAGQSGSYTRRGNIVHFQGFVNYNTLTGTGELAVTGLPYAAREGIGNSGGYAVNVIPSSLTFTGQLAGFIVPGESRIRIWSAASGASVAGVAVDAAAILRVSGWYECAA